MRRPRAAAIRLGSLRLAGAIKRTAVAVKPAALSAISIGSAPAAAGSPADDAAAAANGGAAADGGSAAAMAKLKATATGCAFGARGRRAALPSTWHSLLPCRRCAAR